LAAPWIAAPRNGGPRNGGPPEWRTSGMAALRNGEPPEWRTQTGGTVRLLSYGSLDDAQLSFLVLHNLLQIVCYVYFLLENNFQNSFANSTQRNYLGIYDKIAVENGFPNFKGSWPWPRPWIGSYCIPSCITHRPLRTCQISLNSKKLFVNGQTDEHLRPVLLGRLWRFNLKIHNYHLTCTPIITIKCLMQNNKTYQHSHDIVNGGADSWIFKCLNV